MLLSSNFTFLECWGYDLEINMFITLYDFWGGTLFKINATV